MPDDLQLVLLGVPRFLLRGVPLELRYGKTCALLAYLGVRGERERRERLAGLLWSDKDEGDARTNLRTVLSSVRKVLGDRLEINRHSVGLIPGSYYLDVTDFVTGVHSSSEARLVRAVELYRGDLLEGFSVAGAPLFDEWLSAERARLRDLALGALHGLARRAAERGAYDEAAKHLERLRELDPWREDSTRHLMRVLAAGGRPGTALARYAQLHDMLEREFGLSPSPETVSLYEALSSPAQNARDATAAHNVPAFLTSFVARPQTGEVQKLLADPACRLLTLIGAGGSGKTRLAAEVAARLAPDFAQGVWYVSLASLTAPEDLMPTVADVLGIAADDASLNHHEAVLSYLRNRQLLLVLDNFEHLLAAKTFVRQLLETAAGVKVLVTSRVRLGLQGEWTFPVGGLAYPQLAEHLTLPGDALETFGALALFKQSALRVRPGHHFGADDVRVIAHICHLVNGLPLAVELAAGWLRALTLAEIRQEIERDLGFLATPGEADEMSSRHSSLRNVFEHTWQRLSSEEQAALRRSAVFVGEFDRNAALAVVSASLHTLNALVDKTLLYREAGNHYRHHVLVKSFLAEKAAEEPAEEADTRLTYSHHYLDKLYRSAATLVGAKQDEALADLVPDLDNIRRAWDVATKCGDGAALERVLPALARLYTIQDRFREAEAVFGGAAERFPIESPTRARLTVRAAFSESELGHHELARRNIENALSVLKRRGSPADIALALYTLGFILYSDGDYEGAKAAFSESLCLYQELNDPHGVADAINYLGNVEVLLGDYASAKTLIAEALALKQANGESRWAIAKTLSELGEAAFQAGELDEAEAYHQEVLTLCQGMSEANRQISALTRIGEVSFERGQVEEAEYYYRQALRLALERYAPRRIALALLGICDVLAYKSRLDEALEPLYAIVRDPGSPGFYRKAAETKIRALTKNISAHRAAALKARAATKDLLELAESVLGENSTHQ